MYSILLKDSHYPQTIELFSGLRFSLINSSEYRFYPNFQDVLKMWFLQKMLIVSPFTVSLSQIKEVLSSAFKEITNFDNIYRNNF